MLTITLILSNDIMPVEYAELGSQHRIRAETRIWRMRRNINRYITH